MDVAALSPMPDRRNRKRTSKAPLTTDQLPSTAKVPRPMRRSRLNKYIKGIKFSIRESSPNTFPRCEDDLSEEKVAAIYTWHGLGIDEEDACCVGS